MSSVSLLYLKRFCVASAALSTVLLSHVSVSQAAVIFATDFEAPAYTLGNLNGQNDWYTIESNTPFASVVSLNGNQVVQSRTDTFITHLVEYTPASNERVVVGADIAANFEYSTTGSGMFGFTIYSETGTRVAQFGLSRTGTSTANTLSLLASTRSSSGTPQFLILGNNWQQNTLYNFRGEFDFTAKTWDFYNGTTLLRSGLAFIDQSATALGDAAIVGTGRQSSDRGYLDNFSVTTTVVPEANTAALLGWCLAPTIGIVIARRRKTAA